MHIYKFNEEVFYTKDDIVKVAYEDIYFLKQKAKGNKRRRIRLCAHKNTNDSLHEMLIIHRKNNYIRPHKHLKKSESLHVIEGIADMLIFDKAGNITKIIQLGSYKSGRRFFFRISQPVYHCLIINSEFFIFHEVTNGPFKKSDTVFPSWSPEETNTDASRDFMNKLRQNVETFSQK